VIIQFESVVIAVKTAQCRWKGYVPKFTAASRGTPCDSTTSCVSRWEVLYSRCKVSNFAKFYNSEQLSVIVQCW